MGSVPSCQQLRLYAAVVTLQSQVAEQLGVLTLLSGKRVDRMFKEVGAPDGFRASTACITLACAQVQVKEHNARKSEVSKPTNKQATNNQHMHMHTRYTCNIGPSARSPTGPDGVSKCSCVLWAPQETNARRSRSVRAFRACIREVSLHQKTGFALIRSPQARRSLHSSRGPSSDGYGLNR